MSHRFPIILRRLKQELQRWDAEEELPYDTSRFGGGLQNITVHGWVEQRIELMHLSLDHLQIQASGGESYSNVRRK